MSPEEEEGALWQSQPSVSSMLWFTPLLGEIPQDTETRAAERRKAEIRRLEKPQVKAPGVAVSPFGVLFSEMQYLGRKGEWSGEPLALQPHSGAVNSPSGPEATSRNTD